MGVNMTTQAAVALASNATKSGILNTLSPWQLVVAGVVLISLAGIIYWANERKLNGDSFILEMAALICGFGGLFALYQGIFGS